MSGSFVERMVMVVVVVVVLLLAPVRVLRLVALLTPNLCAATGPRTPPRCDHCH